MVRFRFSIRFMLAVLPAAMPLACADKDTGKIRVACMGDSITYGAKLDDREAECYPAQLGRLLGPGYRVRNFGENGATLLNKGDKPYIKERAYKLAKEFEPNIIIILLGANDAKLWNWEHESDFISDYKTMIKELSALESKPKIWLCTPVPAYPRNYGIDDERIKTAVVPKVEAIATDCGLPIIDLYKALSDKPKLFPDKVHPNAAGAALLARTVYQALTSVN